MTALGVSAAEIDIKPAAQQMLADIGHPFAEGKKVYDVTFENVQAGLRTDYLFRLANQHRGMVVGTGDLSELGLGWCTYGVGDHMSHYNPNGSVSKTLIQHLIRFVAASGDVSPETAEILHDILNTEISPELIPVGAGGVIQSTEQTVGSLCAAGFQPLLPDAPGLSAVQDRVPGLECLARHREGRLARQPAGRHAPRLRAARDPGLAEALPAPLLHQPVQAFGAAQRPQDLLGRLAVAAGRLARPVGRQPRCLAGRAGRRSRKGEIAKGHSPAGETKTTAPRSPPYARNGRVQWPIQL